jgi:hypothetical protein
VAAVKATHTPLTDAPMTPAELLRAVARYLQVHGWTQEVYYDTRHTDQFPPACIEGALRMVVFGHISYITDIHAYDPDTSAAVAALNALAAHLDCDFDPQQTESTHIIGHWNDYPGRKPTEILAALHEAADEWDRLHHQGGENR